MVQRIENEELKASIALDILNRLPKWFGIPESTAEYAAVSRTLPFFAFERGGAWAGFAALKETSPYTVELYVMGVLEEYHREGIGRQLFDALYACAREAGYSFLQVKTVQKGRYDEYDRTNLFYQRMGFKELECFPTLWAENSPCQIYVMDVK